MRQNVVAGPADFDAEAREVILQAAERSGMSIDEWIGTVLADRAPRAAATPIRNPEPQIPAMRPSASPSGTTDIETLLAALRADRAPAPAKPAPVRPLTFETSWNRPAERPAPESSPPVEQQQRLGSAFAQALATIKGRLDDIERSPTPSHAAVRGTPIVAPRPVTTPNAKVVPLAKATEPNQDLMLASLKGDIANLAAQIAARQEDPAVAALRSELQDLQASLEGLATRNEVVAIEQVIRDLALHMTQAKAKDDVKVLSGALADLQQQVRRLSSDIPEGVHRRVGSAIELLNWKVDIAAANGVDASTIQNLESQITEVRRSLAELAEPQRIERVSREIAALGEQVAELRRLHADRGDVTALRADMSSSRDEIVALRRALDELRSTVVDAEAARLGSPLPQEWDSLSRRLDSLLSRPEAADLEPVNDRLTAIAEHLAGLRAEHSQAKVATTIESRFNRLDDRLLQVAQGLDTTSLEAVLQALAGKVDELQASHSHIAALEHQVGAVASRLERDDAANLQTALDEIRDSLRMGAGSPADAAILQQLQQVGEQLSLLASRPQATLDPLHDRLAAIADQLERAPTAGPADPKAFELQFDRLASRLDQIAATPAHGDELVDRFDRIEDILRELGQSADTAGVEILLRALGTKIDEVHSSQSAFGAIESQLQALQARLDESQRPDPALDALHQALNDAIGQMMSLREEASAIADRAARTAVEQVQASAAPADVLYQGIDELRALHASMDERTNQTLLAIQAAMDNLAERLPALAAEATSVARLEAAVRKLRSAAEDAESGTPTSPAPATARFVPPTTPPSATAQAPAQGVALMPPPGVDATSLRANLIAAARRTAQAPADAPAPASKVEPTQDEEPVTAEGLGERIRRSLQARRRSMLLAAAASVLIVGVVQIAGTFRNGETAAPVSAGGAETGAAVGAKASDTAKIAPTKVASTDATAHLASRSDGAPVRVSEPPADRPSAAEPVPAAASITKLASLRDTREGAALVPASAPAAAPAAAAPAVIPTMTMPALVQQAAATPPAPRTTDELPAGIPAGLRQAVLAGNSAAIYELAFLISEGRDMPKDPVLAVKLFERAANAGLAPAQFHLGHIYEKGLGVPKDLVQAHDWYRRAAERGNARAMHNLAVLLAGGVNGKPNYPAALPWFRQAADLGVRDSQFNLAVVLAWGIGAPRNLMEAYKWFAIVGNQGDQEATAKRDEIAAQLAPADLAAAKALVESWRVRTADQAANVVPVPPQGWSAAPEAPNSRG